MLRPRTRPATHPEAEDDKNKRDTPGWRAVKAVGWWVEEYGIAQVSMNLDDFTVTPPHVAFEECVRKARAASAGTSPDSAKASAAASSTLSH